jgi:hypothetical protein
MLYNFAFSEIARAIQAREQLRRRMLAIIQNWNGR